MKKQPLLFALTLGLAAVAAAGCGDDPDPAGADLDGAWQTPCFQGTTTRLVYTDLDLTGTFTEFSDQACVTPRHVTTWTGQATVGAEVSPGVRKLDLTFASFRSKPLTDAEAALVNQNAYCGITDWAAGVERDVLGRACFGFAIPVGGRSLDLYQIDGDALRFGQGAKILVAPTEADRPTAIDPNRVFTRS